MTIHAHVHRHMSCLLLMMVALNATAQTSDPVEQHRAHLFEVFPVKEGRPLQAPKGAAQSFRDVAYLGPKRNVLMRLTLDQRDARAKAGHPYGLEYRTRFDLHLPPGDGPFPLLVGIHGGAYSGGDKRAGASWTSSRQHPFTTAALAKGYAVASINYILGQGIHPQVQRDTREFVRFVRANAGLYKLDPHRIALLGASAGGWLCGSSALTTADDG